MTRTKPWVALALAGAVAFAPSVAGDVLRPHNTATKEIGALVDGTRDNVAVNDETYLALASGGFFGTLFPTIPIANFTTSARGEVIAFARRRPPLLAPDLIWTAASNTIDLDFDDEYRIDVQVWILHPDETLPAKVADNGVAVAQIWAEERQGITFDQFSIEDASDDPDAAQLLDFNCGAAGVIQSLIGHVPGVVNVYYVNSVDYGNGPATTSGVWCPGEQIIAMGRFTSGHLLAHELGHSLNLYHTNGTPEHFDTTNIMHNASSNRKYLTEGQTFRAVYHGFSALNNLYDVRAGKPTRNCTHHYSEANPTCPGVQKRVWPDGLSWPAN